ncbi:MAG TPA: TAXI family TRAP transporter solute-binding subunit [Methylocella sp.]|nr:TAXI family TRAP transporter solute-binding subunit [Methylocella sp.]
MRRFMVGAIIGSLALIATALAVFVYFERPTILRVAFPRDSDDQAILAVAMRSFAETREAIRLKLVPVENLAQSAHALEEGHADLAVVRSDLSMPPSGQTVLIMRRDALLFLAPSQSGLHGVDELRGHKIGVLQSPSAGKVDNRQLLDAVLAQYDVPLDSVQRVYLTIAEVPQALADQKIDTLLAVGVPGSDALTGVVNAVATAEGDQLVFLPVAEAKAIAQRSPAFEGVEVLRGAFGGAQPKPAADFETLGVSTRLVARNRLGNKTAGALARLMLAARPSIAATVPIANRIEAPPADKGALLPVHPGVLAFLDDEEESFLDQYSDTFYIGAMCLSVLGTAIAAAMARLKRQTAPDTDRILRRLTELIRAARSAKQMEALDSCEAEADELLELTLALDMVHGLSPNRVGAIDLALNQLRHVISERRQSLEAPVRAHFVPRIVND